MLSVDTSDPEEVSRLIESNYVPTRIRPGSGGFRFRLEGTAVAGMLAARIENEYAAEIAHLRASPGIGLLFPCSGTVEASSPHWQAKACIKRALILEGTHPCQLRHSDDCRVIALLLNRAELEARLAEQLGRTPSTPLEFRPAIDNTAETATTLRSLAAALVDGARGDAPLLRSPLAMTALRASVLDIVLNAIPHNHADDLMRASRARALPRNVKRAIEFMHAQVASPLSIKDIAAAAGSSPRSLQQAFQSFLDTTPMAYLRDLRLEGAHRALCDPANTSSVASIALAWGFLHLSLFAAHYRQKFGQLPSETRRRP